MSRIAPFPVPPAAVPDGYAPRRTPLPSGLQRACLAAKTAADNKGQDIHVLDLRGLTPMFDFFVLSTGQSRRQVHTIVEEIDAAMRAVGDHRLAVEGYDSSKWVVQDYGDVIAHVFDGDTRDYYKLEELWADAKTIDWAVELDLDPHAEAPDDDADPDLDVDDADDADDADDDKEAV